MMNRHVGRPIGPTVRKRSLDWQKDAACDNNPAFLAEPEDGGWTDRQRITLCTGIIKGTGKNPDKIIGPPCPVIDECLEYAMSLPMADVAHRGLVFGGLTGQQIAAKIRNN